jgi:epoxide hydrolase-like predicted phosphatase
MDEMELGMAIRVVVFDIGGILEVVPGGGDPTMLFPQMLARWEARLGMAPGELDKRLMEIDDRHNRMSKDDEIDDAHSEGEWIEGLRAATGWDQAQIDAFMRDFWDVYCGNPNPELSAYLGSLRPRYRTALLSNSGDGARREEEQRFHFSEIVELIVYSHEEGVAKPDQRIYAIACERLGVRPDEVVFLDDVERNVAAAAAYGMHAILFHDNAQAIADINACLAAHSG